MIIVYGTDAKKIKQGEFYIARKESIEGRDIVILDKVESIIDFLGRHDFK